MRSPREAVAVAAACPRCGRPVRPGEVFCGTCGTPLGFEPTAGSVLPLVGPDEGARRVTQLVSRAEVGLLLLIGAALTSWVPAIVWVGGLLGIAGAALLLAGREPFGAAHTRNVAVALFLVIGAGVGVDLIRMSLDTAVASAVQLGPAAAPRAIFAAFQDFLFLSVIVSFVSGLGYVLLAYALEDTVGRLALATALALLVFLNVAIYVAVMGQLGPALNAAFSSTSPNPGPLQDLVAQVDAYGLLALVPDALYAGAFFLAWSRIRRGEIPARPAPVPVSLPPDPL